MTLKSWNTNKMLLAPVAALILWVVSVLCFVFGLSFKNPIGYTIQGMDVSMMVALALSLANTIIQLIGNGKDPKDMDTVFMAGWYASYVLGISSNINALLQILDMGNTALEWGVAASLGTMIEVMPEKLIIIWLKNLPVAPAPVKHQPSVNQAFMGNLPKGNQKPNNYPNAPRPYPKPAPKPQPRMPFPRRDEEEGTYEIGMMG
jgi:hypothetical protein